MGFSYVRNRKCINGVPDGSKNRSLGEPDGVNYCLPFISTDEVQSSRYDLNHFSAVSRTHTLLDKRDVKISRSMVSNAAVRSNDKTSTTQSID